MAEKVDISYGRSIIVINNRLCFRGLNFFVCFFQHLIEDYDNNVESENLSSNLKLAYAESLERYHSWLGTQLFSVNKNFVFIDS